MAFYGYNCIKGLIELYGGLCAVVSPGGLSGKLSWLNVNAIIASGGSTVWILVLLVLGHLDPVLYSGGYTSRQFLS